MKVVQSVQSEIREREEAGARVECGWRACRWILLIMFEMTIQGSQAWCWQHTHI